MRCIRKSEVFGWSGNLSIVDRQEGLIAITPTGQDYFETRLQDIVVLQLDGEVVEGERPPSNELRMHKIFYRNREDINALVHVRSRYATALSCLHWELPAVHYLVAFAGSNVRCAPYATCSSQELAEKALEAMEDRKAVLLANHNLLAGGQDLPTAFTTAEQIEFCAELYYMSRLVGDPKILPTGEMERVAEKFKKYGLGSNLSTGRSGGFGP